MKVLEITLDAAIKNIRFERQALALDLKNDLIKLSEYVEHLVELDRKEKRLNERLQEVLK